MGQKIRVLAVIRHPVGGIRTFLKYTYGSLARNRYQFVIVTVDDDEGRLLEEDLREFQVEVVRTRGRYRLPAMIWKVFTVGYRKEADVIHSHGLTAGVLAIIGNAVVGLPHIITSHEVLRKEQFPGLGGTLKRKLLGLMLSRAGMIHCVSGDAHRNLLEFLPALRKHRAQVVVIPHGVRLHHVRDGTTNQRRPLRPELGLDENIVLLGFCGRFMPEKGFTSLIDAVESLAADKRRMGNFKVLAVNDGAFVREYKAIIRRKELQECFVFHGFMPDIRTILRELDAVIIPSLWEASSLVAMEAFVTGCPVIASECIGLREVVRDTPAVRVTSGDPHCLAKALTEVIMDRDRYKRSALEFVPAARRRFDVTRSAAELDVVFGRLTKTEACASRI